MASAGAWTPALVAFAGEEALAAAAPVSLAPLLVGGTAAVVGLGFVLTVVFSSGNTPEVEPRTIVAMVDQGQRPQPPDPEPVPVPVPDPEPERDPEPEPEPVREPVPREASGDLDEKTLAWLVQLGYIVNTPAVDPSATTIPPPGMVFIPGGDFALGVTTDELRLFSEAMLGRGRKPQDLMLRSVISGAAQATPVEPFYIDVKEVTSAQYLVYLTETGAVPPSNWENGEIPRGTENHPVSFVTFDDASAYAQWAGKRLPTESEWEKAARGGDARWFPWGSEWKSDRCRWEDGTIRGTAPVGSFEEGASPQGILDLAGNVWEWTASEIRPYPGNGHDPEFHRARGYVIRGGSFTNRPGEKAVALDP